MVIWVLLIPVIFLSKSTNNRSLNRYLTLYKLCNAIIIITCMHVADQLAVKAFLHLKKS